MRSLTYRPAAVADLDAVYEIIELDSPRRALNFIEDIQKRCRNLCTYPQLGRARDDLAPGIRIYPMLGRVVVAYRVTEAAIVITRVFYGGQDYETILLDEDNL